MRPSSVAVFNAMRLVDSFAVWLRTYQPKISMTGTAYSRIWIVLPNILTLSICRYLATWEPPLRKITSIAVDFSGTFVNM